MKKTKKALATLLAIMSTASALCIPMSAATVEQNLNSQSEITTLSASVAANVTYTIGNYSYYAETQVGNSCWASCILSVIKWNNSTAGITLSDIYAQTNRLCSLKLSVGDAAPTSAASVITNYYLGTTYKNSALTDSQVINHLVNNQPIIGIFTGSASTYHNMVIYGYERDANMNIIYYYVMNPQTGTTERVAKSTNYWLASLYRSDLV